MPAQTTIWSAFAISLPFMIWTSPPCPAVEMTVPAPSGQTRIAGSDHVRVRHSITRCRERFRVTHLCTDHFLGVPLGREEDRCFVLLVVNAGVFVVGEADILVLPPIWPVG